MRHRLTVFSLVLLLTSTSSVVAQKKKKLPSKPSIVWVNQPKPGQLPLPPNTRHLTFRSQLVNQDIGYCIYLPPSYQTSPGKRFPVIYNLHGNGGNEFTSVDSIAVLHQGITAGRWPELILVLIRNDTHTDWTIADKT